MEEQEAKEQEGTVDWSPDHQEGAPPFLSISELEKWVMQKKNRSSLIRRGPDTDLPSKNLLKNIENRDHVFLIDDSYSMRAHWQELLATFSALAYLVKGADKDGIELEFSSSKRHYRAKNTTTLAHHVKGRPLSEPSNIEDSLGRILEGYIKEQVLSRKRLRPRQGLSIYVLTDGVWRSDSDPTEVIKKTADALQQLGASPGSIGIQFIKFGQDEIGNARLLRLDDELDFGRCHVDTENSDGNVWKMLLGSVSESWDEEPLSSVPHPTPGRILEQDSDLEDDALSDIFSDVSAESGGSATSNESAGQRQAALEALQRLLGRQPKIEELLQEAGQNPLLSSAVFQKRIYILLKEFSADLEATATLPSQRIIVGFVTRCSGQLSKDIATRIFRSESRRTSFKDTSQAGIKSDRTEGLERLVNWLSRLDQEEQSSKVKMSPDQQIEVPAREKNRVSMLPGHDSYTKVAIDPYQQDTTGEDSSSDEGNLDIPEPQALTKFLTGNHAFDNLTTNLRRFMTRYRYDWYSIDLQWRRELSTIAPPSLRSSGAGDVDFLEAETPGLLDSLKMSMESYTGKAWNWEPLLPPVYPFPPGKVRLKWICTCGRRLTIDVSPNLALKVGEYLLRNNQSSGTIDVPIAQPSNVPSTQPANTPSGTPAFGNTGPSTNPSLPSAASVATPYSVPNQGGTGGYQGNTSTSSALGPTQPSQSATAPPLTYVLLCVDRHGKLRSAQMNVKDFKSDDEFFETLKSQYRGLRGFWHYWFHPEEYDYCSFSKFERYYVDHLSWKCNELPDHTDYQYIKQLPLKPYVAPIPPEEWRHRFHGLKTGQRLEALPLIPQRVQRFQISTHISREDFWGLNVEYRPSFRIILAWHVLITSGGWGFIGWWLKGHPGDLQNAVVVITVILGVLILFWSLIDKRFTHRRDNFKIG
ncbi:Nn.00g042800.m01.CDS01 [Neocucurbitaria sp. VM-36]